MKRYIVSTHLGDFATFAASPAKAINNIRYRIFGRVPSEGRTKYWTVREAV